MHADCSVSQLKATAPLEAVSPEGSSYHKSGSQGQCTADMQQARSISQSAWCDPENALLVQLLPHAILCTKAWSMQCLKGRARLT